MEPGAPIPLLRRFPALGQVPRAHIGRFPTPVTKMAALAPGLWFKREDLSADPLGGNKARALDFLLGDLRAGDRIVTVGAEGSTHALATAIYARRLGAHPVIYRWPQEMTDTARAVSHRLLREFEQPDVQRGLVAAYARAVVARLRGARWVPAGGSTPVGILGQVNAALELNEQIEDGVIPRPDRVVVPLGTGGTLAGLVLGFAIANLESEVVGVRVVPRVVANLAHVRRLVSRTARLIERRTGERIPRPRPNAIRVIHDFYGGAYGRATSAGTEVAGRCLALTGIEIDPTYGAKALAGALALHEREEGTTLFWLSFDARWLRGVVALP
jgi:D-cysteine desulfhydrase